MIYDYECDKCGFIEFEYKIGKAPLKTRCKCGKIAMRKFVPPSISIPSPVSEARKGRGKGRI